FHPWVGGVLAATLTVSDTFLPSFLFIFAGAPYMEAVRGNRALAGALAAITASVVGVILNLAVWFSLHVLFARVGEGPLGIPLPEFASVQPLQVVLAVGAALAMLKFHQGMIRVLAVSGGIGMLAQLVG
ncbi:MAG: chromate transporter, partial [Rhodospirillaceae bacterium]|nr:chromate transporter [Rhodospirillales bacterium]